MLPLASFRILALLLMVSLQLAVAVSPVSTGSYSLGPGEALLDAIPRARGGTYLVVGKPLPFTVVAVISTSPPPADINFTSGAVLGAYRVSAIRRLDELDRGVTRIEFPDAFQARYVRAVADSDGGLVLLANSRYEGLPVADPLFPLPPPVPEFEGDIPQYGYLLRTNATGTAILRATLLGGNQRTFSRRGTTAMDLARDSSGNLYVTGSTGHTDFPVTAGAAKPNPGFDSPAKGEEGFLLKVSGDLRRLMFGTFLGSDEPLPTICSPIQFPPSSQIGTHRSAGLAVAVDAQQRAVVYATTNGRPIPATDGAFQRTDPPGTPACQQPFGIRNVPLGFPFSFSLLRFDAAGSRLLSAAYLGRGRTYPYIPSGSTALQMLPDGGVIAALGAAEFEAPPFALRLLKLNAGLSVLEAEQSLASDEFFPVIPGSATLQSDGSYWLAGRTWSGALPASRIVGQLPSVDLGEDLLLRFRGTNLQPAGLWTLPNGSTSAGLRNSLGAVDVLSTSGSRVRVPLLGGLFPAILGTANAAGLRVKPTVSPYEMFSLYGDGLGPAAGASAAFTPTGDLPTVLGGVRVWLDGVAAPLLYTSNRQLNLIAPAQLADRAPGSRVLLEVERDGIFVATATLNTVSADPHFFRHSDPLLFREVIVLNQDGSINSMLNPAARGEAIVLFLNGGGAPPDRFPAGRRVLAARPFSTLAPSVESPRDLFLANLEPSPMIAWPVEYFGAAPTLAAGTLQMNVRIPQEIALPVSDVGAARYARFLFTPPAGASESPEEAWVLVYLK